MRRFISGLLILTAFGAGAQVLSYNKSVYFMNGQPGDFLTPELQITNTATSQVQVYINRVEQNLPANWAMCYCFIQCHPPSLDSLRFDMAPGETVTVGIGFTTDGVNGGMGSVRLAVHAVGSNQKDTLGFSATTTAVGLEERSAAEGAMLFPSPASDQVSLSGNTSLLNEIQIVDMSGRSVQKISAARSANSIPLSHLPAGHYFINLHWNSGKITQHKIIKN